MDERGFCGINDDGTSVCSCLSMTASSVTVLISPRRKTRVKFLMFFTLMSVFSQYGQKCLSEPEKTSDPLIMQAVSCIVHLGDSVTENVENQSALIYMFTLIRIHYKLHLQVFEIIKLLSVHGKIETGL